MNKYVFLIVMTWHCSLFAMNGNPNSLISQVTCTPWHELELEFESVEEEQALYANQVALQKHITGAEDQIHTALETGDPNEAVVTCAFIEYYSHGFQSICIDNAGNDVITEDLVQTCKSLKKIDFNDTYALLF